MRIVSALLFAAACLPASAAVFVIDSSSDDTLSACTAAAADCSLRGAIIAANLTPADDTIEFNLPTDDPGFQPATQHWLILVGTTALPFIETRIIIDGLTQPGAIANTNRPSEGGLNGSLKIELRPGSSSGPQQVGLQIVGNNFAAPASTIRGLAISRFQSQIQLGGSSAHRVEGCYIGTDINGTAASLNTFGGRGNGVRIQGPGAYRIGGLLPAERNLISGLSTGIVFQAVSEGIRIQGNLIGTDVSGTLGIGNISDGIASSAPIRNGQIGGITSDARNIISASHFSALRLFSGAPTELAGTLIEGNYFGTDVSGRKPLGNGLNPSSPSQTMATILIGGTTCSIAIGGSAPGQANLIAFGGAAGIQNDRCLGVATPLNHYHGNRGIPLDNVNGGGFVGSTPNDIDDADDQGGNRMQNFPVIDLPAGFLNSGGSSVGLQYRVDTAVANATYPITVHFYRGACGGGSRDLLATDTITAGEAQQLLPFNLISADGANVLPLVATAVDAAGNTSEFSLMLGDEIFNGDFEDVQGAATAGVCR